MLIQNVLYSPSHMLHVYKKFFFYFQISFSFLICFRIQSSFHRYFLYYDWKKNRKYLLKIYLKINGSFRSYINPIYLHETGPKSCTFTYLYSRWGNRITWTDQRMTFFLLPRKRREKTGLFVPIEEIFYNQLANKPLVLIN